MPVRYRHNKDQPTFYQMFTTSKSVLTAKLSSIQRDKLGMTTIEVYDAVFFKGCGETRDFGADHKR